jgi:hypothetical protein
LLGFGHNIVVTEPQIVEQLCELIVLMNWMKNCKKVKNNN